MTFNPVRELEVPRALASLNGQPFSVQDYTITWNAHGVLDTCEFTVPSQGNPDFTTWLFQNETDTSPIPIIIYVGFPSQPGPVTISQLTQRFVGQLDQYTIDHKAGTVKIQGRSMGAILGDRQLTTPISYQTSLQLLEAVTTANGLALNFKIYGSPIQMAEVFSREFVAGVKNFREWDLILQCSQYDDADVFVDGNTLYYVNPNLVQRNNVNLDIGQDLENLTVTHASQLNRKIRVEVRTYSPTKRQSAITRVQTRANGDVVVNQVSRTSTSQPIWGTTGVVTTYYSYNSTTGSYTKASGTSFKSGGNFQSSPTELANSGLERYIIYKPGLSPQACANLAFATWRRLSMHQFSATIELPMRSDLFSTVNRFALFNLAGSPYSRCNGKFWPRRITESSNLSSGAKWQIESANSSPPLGSGTS